MASTLTVALLANSSTVFLSVWRSSAWCIAVCCLVMGSRIPTGTDFMCMSLMTSSVKFSISVMRAMVSVGVFAGLR